MEGEPIRRWNRSYKSANQKVESILQINQSQGGIDVTNQPMWKRAEPVLQISKTNHGLKSKEKGRFLFLLCRTYLVLFNRKRKLQ